MVPFRTAVRAAAVAAGILVLGSLGGCSIVSAATSHEKEQVFAARENAPTGAATGSTAAGADADLDFVLPALVPSDAVNIRIRVSTDGPGKVLRFESATALADAGCSPGALVGAPLLDTTWWPVQVPAEGTGCDSGWQVFGVDGATYAWLSE